jgi:tetratricopeptide (TPR) repeat protein
MRALPERWVPLALNLFAAVCGALTLGLLARSVILLPHDRTHEQREREQSPAALLTIRLAWLPPLLAVVFCGLQLSFWENATAAISPAAPWGSGCDILDLLLFAYIIRCLLEYRIDERDSWLYRVALASGIAMTNNWAMIAFLPLLLIALIWIKGLAFFNPRFLLRTALWGVAGLSLYLLLPILQSSSSNSPISFWQALRTNLGAQKYALLSLPFNKPLLFGGDRPLWVLALPSLLPLAVIGIRWPSYFGDPSRLGVTLATLIFHVFHGVLFVVCTWTMLDPQFSPRGLAPGMSLLTLYYLTALTVGYLAGYFLLVFGGRAPARPRPPFPGLKTINRLVTLLVMGLALAATSTLIYRNLPQIRMTNSPHLHEYASFLAQALPQKGPTLVLSDDPRKLVVVRSAAGESRRANSCVFLDTGALKWPEYHRFLKTRYKTWQAPPIKDPKQTYEDADLLQLVFELGRSNSIYYVHPSFGYYFERFYPEPHGLAYELKPYPTNALFPPPLGQEIIAENEKFWADLDLPTLEPLVAALTPPNPSRQPSLLEKLLDFAHLKFEPNSHAAELASFYSRALNVWGVAMQQSGNLQAAAAHFDRAVELNPDNVVARANLENNRNFQAGRPSTPLKSLEEKFGKYRYWDQVLSGSGPFDDSVLCYEQGGAFLAGGLYRQAAIQFERTRSLAPDHLAARLWLAQIYVMGQMPDPALKLLQEVYADPERFRLGRTNQNELVLVEAAAHLLKTNVAAAEAAVQRAVAKYPGDASLLASASQVFMKSGLYSNAIQMINQELKITPNNTSALINKGFCYLQLGAYGDAIPPLTKALTLETNNHSALLNRAIAYLRGDQLDLAQQDYESLQKVFPTAFQIYYGLGDIAYRKKDTNAAIRNYQVYLTNAPPNLEETKFVSARLKELKPPSP